MENEEEHQENADLEDPDEGEPLPPPDYSREPEQEDVSEAFSCPICGAITQADATSCTGCGAVFSSEEEVTETEDAPQPQTETEGMEDPENQDVQPQQTEEEGIQEPVSQEISQTQYGMEGMQDPAAQEEGHDDAQAQQRITSAMTDYEGRRKKRYLTGALCLGLGLVLFVLVWLLVVNQVLVEETDKVFGLDVILILLGAGILFILGLFLVLTYPSSSLSEIVSLEPANPQPTGYNPGQGGQPLAPPEYGTQ